MGYASTSAEWAVHNLQFWHNAQEHLVRRRRRWNRKHTTASKASKWQKSRMRAAPVLKKIHPTEKKYLNPPKKNRNRGRRKSNGQKEQTPKPGEHSMRMPANYKLPPFLEG